MAVSQWSNGANGGTLPEPFPLVGRSKMLATLESLMEASPRDVSAALIAGESGSGKTRVAEEFAARAVRRGWTVAEGRAYPVERGVPFALFSDAFLPILHELEPSTLTVMTRGGEAELAHLFPTLGEGPTPAIADMGSEPDEFRTRLFWNFSEFLKNYAKRTPLLVVLEDLQWADASSLELLHFVVRHAKGRPLFFLCTFDEAARTDDGNLQQIQRSLLSLDLAVDHRLEPLTRDDVAELTTRVFCG